MATPEERMQVLKLIEAGQITAEEGAKLLAALGDAPREPGGSEETKGRWFRVRVSDQKTGKTKVNVTIPLSLVNVGMKMGARFAPGVDAIDVNELHEAVRRGTVGKMFDIEDEEQGEHVEIYVE